MLGYRVVAGAAAFIYLPAGKGKSGKRGRGKQAGGGAGGSGGGSSAVRARLSEELTTYLRRYVMYRFVYMFLWRGGCAPWGGRGGGGGLILLGPLMVFSQRVLT